jgi:hypothetical protein
LLGLSWPCSFGCSSSIIDLLSPDMAYVCGRVPAKLAATRKGCPILTRMHAVR